jgi:hypothetical protein
MPHPFGVRQVELIFWRKYAIFSAGIAQLLGELVRMESAADLLAAQETLVGIEIESVMATGAGSEPSARHALPS